MVLTVAVVAEIGARIIGPNIPRVAGSEERAFVKADQLSRRTGPTDLVILGSSETAGGLVPSTLLAEVPELNGGYNAALAGSSLDLEQQWWERIVSPRTEPKVVVIGMTYLSALDIPHEIDEDGGGRRAIEAYEIALDQIDPPFFGRVGREVRERVALVRHRTQLRSPLMVYRGIRNTLDASPKNVDDSTALDFNKETDPERVLRNTEPDGDVRDYWSESEVLDADPSGAAIYNRLTPHPFTARQLSRLVQSIRDRGAQPVIALGPIDRIVLAGGGADLDRVDEIVGQIIDWADQNQVPINDQTSVTWARSNFHDRQHVSRRGELRWSRTVGAWLAELCAANTLSC